MQKSDKKPTLNDDVLIKGKKKKVATKPMFAAF